MQHRFPSITPLSYSLLWHYMYMSNRSCLVGDVGLLKLFTVELFIPFGNDKLVLPCGSEFSQKMEKVDTEMGVKVCWCPWHVSPGHADWQATKGHQEKQEGRGGHPLVDSLVNIYVLQQTALWILSHFYCHSWMALDGYYQRPKVTTALNTNFSAQPS